jgi:ElaB/YqjD/DUF883 family membrane-anchored ribosome-binding protein
VAQERDDRDRGPVNGAGEDTARIREEIELTREHLSGTIGELQERLRPEVLVQQAKDKARGAVEQKVRTMMHTASDTAQRAAEQAKTGAATVAQQVQGHPVPAAAIAAGLTFWMTRDPYGSGNGTAISAALAAGAIGYYLFSQRLVDEQGHFTLTGDELRAKGESAREGVRQLGETAEEYARRAQSAVGEYAEHVGDYAGQVGEQVRRASDTARVRMEETTAVLRERQRDVAHTMERWVQANPLAVGAAALALGVVAGLAVPSTETERHAAASIM